MTKQTLKRFALSLACLGLLRSASLSLAQAKLGGPREGHHQPSQAPQLSSHHPHTPPPGSPSYTFSLFDFPQAPNTAGFTINDNFEIVGSSGATVPQGLGGNGFLLQVGEKKGIISESYQIVNVPGEPANQFANGINDSGQIVGAYIDASGNYDGYELSGGTFTPVAYPGATSTAPSQINNSGTIVGAWGATLVNAFELTGSVYTNLVFPGSILTSATGINNGGDIVGFYDDTSNVTHGFLLSRGVYTSIDFPGAVLTYATAINDSGDIVGAYCTTVECTDYQNTIQGFLLSKGVFATINVPDSTSTIVFGINNKSVVVGSYGNCDTGSGLAHAFVATP
jgi:probable HAF family extracellular repeat protein